VKDPQIKIEGDVHILKSIPFDYREQHSGLFTKEALKTMMEKAIGQNSSPAGPSNEMTGSAGFMKNSKILSLNYANYK